MKLRVTFKDPNTIDYALDAALDAEARTSESLRALDNDEREAVLDLRREKAKGVLRRWVEHGKYVTIEFDLANGSARVLTREELA